MAQSIAGPEIERLIQLLARLPGLGPRSARRAALHLIKKREQLLGPLGDALKVANERVRVCSSCGNIDTSDPCTICRDPRRDASLLVVVEDVSDLWALERSGAVQARYHVLGGVLSALDGVGPEQLNLDPLVARAGEPGGPTLMERRRAQEEERRDDAAQHPLVRAVLTKFPGAEIVNVREAADEAGSDALAAEWAEPDDERLSDA